MPPGAEHIERANQMIAAKEGVEPRIWLFALPMVALVLTTRGLVGVFLLRRRGRRQRHAGRPG